MASSGGPAAILAPPKASELRAHLVELVERDLLGPARGPGGSLPPGEQPRDRYLVGLLAPRRLRVEADADEDLAAADESGEGGKGEPEGAGAARAKRRAPPRRARGGPRGSRSARSGSARRTGRGGRASPRWRVVGHG